MKTSLLVLALLLSSLSLGLQLQKNHPAPLFEKYLTTATVSEYDFRRLVADKEMIHDSAVMHNGIGVPFIYSLSDDHQRIICRAMVSEDHLPKSYDERKEALLEAAWMAVGDVALGFGLSLDEKSTGVSHAVKVEFLSIGALAAKKDSAKDKPYAEFVDGELTFH